MSFTYAFALMVCGLICLSVMMISVSIFWDTFYPVWAERKKRKKENIVDSVKD